MDQSVHGLLAAVWRLLGAAFRGGQHPPGAVQLSEPLERKAGLFGVVWNNTHSSVLECRFSCALPWVTNVTPQEWLSLLMVWYGFVLMPWWEGMAPGVCQVVPAFWHCSGGLACSNQLWISGNEWLHRRPKDKASITVKVTPGDWSRPTTGLSFLSSGCDIECAWVNCESYWQVTEILGGCMASHFV